MPGSPTAEKPRGLSPLRRGQCCWGPQSRSQVGAIRRPPRRWFWYRIRRCRDSRARVISNTERLPVADSWCEADRDYRVSLAETQDGFHNERSFRQDKLETSLWSKVQITELGGSGDARGSSFTASV